MTRFSIIGLMGWILVVAVSLAAMRDANESWASVMVLLVLALFAVSLVGLIYRRGRDQAFWLGFALFGGGYFALAFVPQLTEPIVAKLVTTQILEYVHSRVVPPRPPNTVKYRTYAVPVTTYVTSTEAAEPGKARVARRTVQPRTTMQMRTVAYQTAGPSAVVAQGTPSPNQWKVLFPGAANRQPFLRVGHSLFTLLAGVLGAFVAARVQAAPIRSENGHEDGSRQ
jgi:uncharacterized membrane protein